MNHEHMLTCSSFLFPVLLVFGCFLGTTFIDGLSITGIIKGVNCKWIYHSFPAEIFLGTSFIDGVSNYKHNPRCLLQMGISHLPSREL
eukprot:Gb_04793 [translate_table: standard]